MAAPPSFLRGVKLLVVFVLSFALIIGKSEPAEADSSDYVGSAILPNNNGYWLVTASGAVVASGAAEFHGDMRRTRLNQPVIAMAATSTGLGYWLLAKDGGIFSFGDAAFYGSTGNLRLNQPVVAMSATPTGRGYWLVASDGGVFSFGDANFYGSTGSIRLNKPVVGISASADGRGYRMVASDGGIFAFGSASFYGSAGGVRLNSPVVSMSTTPTGNGYWLAGADGGVFAYGDAVFRGSTTTSTASRTIALLRDATGGYTLVRSDGTVDSRPAPVASPPSPGRDIPADSIASKLGWVLREQENFDGNSRSYKWPAYEGLGTAGIGTREASALSVSNGALNITGRGFVTGGTCWCYDGGSQTYGKWEIRARMDNGVGHLPAILLWPESERWPIDGEIDIAEFSNGVRDSSSFTVHYGADNRQLFYSSLGDFTQWHVFGVDWQPTYIKYYLDGVLKYTITDPEAIPKTPMNLALQVDAGNSSWTQPPSPTAVSTLQIDWARIYHP